MHVLMLCFFRRLTAPSREPRVRRGAMNVNDFDDVEVVQTDILYAFRDSDGTLGPDRDFLVFVGVDGGGTSTDCLVRVVDAEKHAEGGVNLDDASTGVVATARCRTGAANANSVGFAKAFANVSTAVFRAVQAIFSQRFAHLRDVPPPDETRVLTRAFFREGEVFLRNPDPERPERATPPSPRLPLPPPHTTRRLHRHRFRLAGMALGLAGCDSPSSVAPWRDALLLDPRTVSPDGFAAETLVVDTDATVALARATKGTARGGAVLIAGTGTVAFAASHLGERARCAGFGPTFDDVGSGHWLGSRALAATARALDGRDHPDLLGEDDRTPETSKRFRDGDRAIARAVMKRLGMEVEVVAETGDLVDVFDPACPRLSKDARREDLLRWAYGDGPAPAWDRVASLAPVLFSESANANAIARRDLTRGSSALAESVARAMERVREDSLGAPRGGDGDGDGDGESVIVAFVGGLFDAGIDREYERRVFDCLETRSKGDRRALSIARYEEKASGIDGDVGGPIAGAVEMALRSYEAWISRNPGTDIFATDRKGKRANRAATSSGPFPLAAFLSADDAGLREAARR